MKLVLILLLACLSLIGGAQQDLDRFIYPLAKPHRAPRISVDVSDLPAAKPWMDRAAMLVHDWYPTVTSLLATEIGEGRARSNSLSRRRLKSRRIRRAM